MELYSPEALGQPEEVRRSRVKAMADEVLAVMKRSEELNVRALRPGCPGWDFASSRPSLPTRFLILVFNFSQNEHSGS